ncbi:hypothetical protein TRFO_14246 [Tritrichomonas foetus]|uniref:IQ calmodulin-binding motif family protein n=1 Tax=Tritrichomonas foetus TaxID=1144522 RepID=A0A1J4KV80_9EUKA|nr:hypothetical protein TRFO_14246 [Tritrichomonas foetus]|eukprot:OHT15225.1 hypothetical protein TRFO_14246 [Tritrichomonas foetus]
MHSDTSSRASSRSLSKVFSNFNKSKIAQSEIADDLLYPEHENYEYRRIRNNVICHGRQSKEDISAVIIQKTYRMFKIRTFFINFLKKFRQVKIMTERPYFIALLLNSHASKCNRKKLYETQFSKTLFCHKILKGYHHPIFEVFTITDQCMLSPDIDGNRLSIFVKKIYKPIVQNIFSEWRLAARRESNERKLICNNETDVLLRKRFGNEYISFSLWFRYTQQKRKRNLNFTGRIPQWDYHMMLKNKKLAKYQKAAEIHLDNKKKLVTQALLNLVLAKKEEEAVLSDADRFHIKRNMMFALSAWAQFIVIQRNKVNMQRAVIKKWYYCVKTDALLTENLKIYKPRHEYFQKRWGLSAFIKNRRISQITNVYLYCKLNTKPSLALFFIATIQNDNNVASFYLAMHAWTVITRRRKKWQQMIFQDLKASNYDYTRRKALAGFRKQVVPITSAPSSYISQRFQQETIYLYEYIMKMRSDYEQVYLLSSDENAKKEVQNAQNLAQQRKIFFQMWTKTKIEPTLLMRISLINSLHQQTKKSQLELKHNEKVMTSYRKAITFLESYNLASESKFRILQRTITENSKRALANRTRCSHRDQMILYAYYSHLDATSLKEIKPLFKTNDKLQVVAKIKNATDELTQLFLPLISITNLGSVLEQPNMYSFSNVKGCSSPIQKMIIDHDSIRKRFDNIRSKSKLCPTTQVQFERLMLGHINSSSIKGSNTYLYLNSYSPPLIENKPMQVSGVNTQLLKMFPLKGRKAIEIGHQSNKTVNFNIINARVEEEEEEEENLDLSLFASQGISGSYDKSKGSMFFQSMKSFSSMLSMSSFGLHSSTETSSFQLEKFDDIIMEEITERSDSSYREEKSDSYSEEEIETNSGRKTIIKIKKKNTNVIEPKKETIIEALKIGFNNDVMNGVNTVPPPKSPNAAKKVKLFMDILFGRNSRDNLSVPITNLRKKLIQELNNQKESNSIPGIQTQETTLPIASLITQYHQDRYKEMNSDDENRPIQRIKSDFSTDMRNLNSENNYSIVSHSKRNRPVPQLRKKTAASGASKKSLAKSIFDGSSSDSSDLKDYYREKPPLIEENEEINEEFTNQNEEEEDKAEVAEGEIIEDIINEDPKKTTSSYSRRTQNKIASPFTAIDDEEANNDPMSKVDKLVFSYVQKNLKNEDEDELNLVEVDSDRDNINREMKKEKIGEKKRKLWQPPKFHPLYKPKATLKHKKLSHPIKSGKPIVIKQDQEVTSSMKKIIKEENQVTKLLYNNGKTVIKPRKQTASSYSSKSNISSVSSNYSNLLPLKNFLEEVEEPKKLHKTDLPKYPDSIKLSIDQKDNTSHEDKVVTFGGGGRQIKEESFNLQKIRASRNNRLIHNYHPRKDNFVYVESAPKKKAKEHEDIRTDYSKMKSIVAQLIQLMSSSQDDANEFLRLRKRARMLRRHPAFVGLEKQIGNHEKKTVAKDQFYGRIQSAYVKYSRRRNARAAADEIITLMQDNADFAPAILKIIEKTAKEETRFNNSRLMKSRIGKTKADEGQTVHFVDLDWMTTIPDYKAVAVQYKNKKNIYSNLEARIAPVNEERYDKVDGKRRRRNRAIIEYSPKPESNWDRALVNFDLSDMLLISSWVSEDVMDAVIAESNATE